MITWPRNLLRTIQYTLVLFAVHDDESNGYIAIGSCDYGCCRGTYENPNVAPLIHRVLIHSRANEQIANRLFSVAQL